jgi:hypothetical protein
MLNGAKGNTYINGAEGNTYTIVADGCVTEGYSNDPCPTINQEPKNRVELQQSEGEKKSEEVPTSGGQDISSEKAKELWKQFESSNKGLTSS